VSARTSRCRAARERTCERIERSTETTIGIIDRRLFDGGTNLNESARTGFLVGTGSFCSGCRSSSRTEGCSGSAEQVAFVYLHAYYAFNMGHARKR
jgi:hypothetical protein